MIIECNSCEALVDAKVLAEREFSSGDDFDPHQYLFLECPACNSIMLGLQDLEPDSEGNWEYGNPSRLYPSPPSYLDHSIPKSVRHSLEEAKKCLRVNAYSASVVMCGRAIEAICKEKVNAKTLALGLKKLKDDKIIDSNLYDWGNALRNERNIGAHANEETISKEDALDVFDFARAFCEYIYVLAERYNDYKKRKIKK